eukprot:TRINITY_DN24684_c0_g1_i1.p2 TRINITY_DN24684_c0_g1~~TRINITY_DN24684_c0_g1_i1.p2  ORF type:complete len:250 (+),score=133.03 TRINITY_DN24684_c0_g1_i1:49-750(+)
MDAQKKKELEEEVKRNVKNIREEGMKEIYAKRMEKLRMEAERVGVFRDNIYHDFTPQQFVEVAWGGGDTETVCLNGNDLPLDNVQSKPSYMFETGEGIKYCLVAFNAETKFLHWVRFNIEGDTKFSTGRDWFRWTPPHPTQQGGKNRIFFFLFHQKEALDLANFKVISKFSREGRDGFDLKKFAAKFNFSIVIGCNCFKTSHRDVSDKVIGSLKDTVDMDENKGKENPISTPC